MFLIKGAGQTPNVLTLTGQFFRRSTLTITVLSLGLGSHTSIAQQGDVQLEEIVVTARKRDESLQQLPLTVTAFGTQDIQDASITNIEDIATLTPSFTFARLLGGSSATPVIRGQPTVIGEPNVGFFLDGVYQSSRAIMDATLAESVERVEVVKGPQNALYGRNTFSGAINFVSKLAHQNLDDKTQGQVSISLGNGGLRRTTASLSGPVALNSDRENASRYNLSAVQEKSDGFFINELTNTELDTRESTVLSGSIRLEPNEVTEVIARVGYDRTRDGDFALRFLDNNFSLANPTSAPIPPALQGYEGEITNYERGFAVTPGHNNHDNLTAALTVKLDLQNSTLTSVTGLNDLQVDIATDNDYEARSIRFINQDTDQTEWSQELRWSSNDQSTRPWMIGAYYYDLETDISTVDRFVDEAFQLSRSLSISPLGGLLPSGIDQQSVETTENFSLFGSYQYPLTPRLTATLEGRWSREEKTVRAIDTNLLNGTTALFEQSAKFSDFLPRLTLAYQADDQNLLYMNVAKAVKTGGFNVNTTAGAILPSERTYQPEESTNYELGIKSTILNGRMNLNLAAFYTDWDDQIVRALGATFATLNANAGQSTVKGIELETQIAVSRGLSFSGGLAYIDSQYDQYTFGALAGLGIDPVLDGTRLQFVSDVQAHASLQYLQAVSTTWQWKSRVDVSYQSDQSVVQTSSAFTDDTTLVNIRTGFSSDHWEVYIWAKNLFEENSAISGVFIPNQATRFDTAASLINPTIRPRGFEAFHALSWSRNPREWGVTAKYRF